MNSSKIRRAKSSALTRETSILCVLFFFSGFPALLYQLVWQRALFQIFGVNIESTTIVVTAFMIGLGVGSLIGGVISKWPRIPLLLILATIEFLIGIYGLFSLELFGAVGNLTLQAPLAVTACVTLALVIVPTLLMGATLPVLVGHLVRRSSNVGNSLGLLYYTNTLGAGAVCLIATVALFPFAGMHDIIHIAVLFNFAVASCAIYIYLRNGKNGSIQAKAKKIAASSATLLIKFPVVLCLACVGGFISLSYEIYFFHTINYATGSSAWAFALTLGAFLIGLASGSRQAAEYCRESDRDKIIRCLLWSIFAANLVGFLFLPLLSHLTFLKRGVLGLAFIMVYLLARNWGVLLPCLAHFGIKPDAKAGMRTAYLYLFNIIGSASGGILTGFILMNHFGLVGLAMLLIAGGTLSALFLAYTLPLSPKDRRTQMIWLASAGAVMLLLLPLKTKNVFENLMVSYADVLKPPFTHVVENRNGIITVDQSGTVYGNGIFDGRFNIDPMNDTNGIIRPYALSLFHPAPRQVLMIGLASGSWAQVVANNPEVNELTIVEINPGYMQLIAGQPEVASLLKNPKVKIVIDDGRRWLHRHPEQKFGVIVANTTFYFRVYASSLLSTDFLEIVKQHLAPGGVYFYNTTDSARVQRTGCESFPYGARFTNHLVVSMSPIDWNFDRWRENLKDYRIDGHKIFDKSRPEVRKAFGRGNYSRYLDKNLIEPCEDILARTTGMKLVTDDNMGSEWRNLYKKE